jgi:hypothetical protein
LVAQSEGSAIVNAPARITLAGLVALVTIVSHAAYRAWPGWHGVEIYLPASMYPADPSGLGYIRIDLPAERLRLEVPLGPRVVPLQSAPNEPQAELFQPVRRAGAGWGSRGEGPASVSRLRGRDLFVQLEPDRPLWPHGPVSMRPLSVSRTPIAGATNLGGHVNRADERGHLWLTFDSHQMAVPPEVAARTKPLDRVREPNRPPTARGRAADPGTFAIFRVLPSGRAVLAGLLVDGKRIE